MMNREQQEMAERLIKEIFRGGQSPKFEDIADTIKSFVNEFKPNEASSRQEKYAHGNAENVGTWEVKVDVTETPTTLNPQSMSWDARETYIISVAEQERIVTGCVPFDSNIGFTKSYNVATGELKTMDYCSRTAITSVKIATDDQKELLNPMPSLEESIEIIRSVATSPKAKRAFSVVLATLYKAYSDQQKHQE